MRIPLSHEQFKYVLAKIFGISMFPDAYLRVERASKKEFANVEAIRVYLPELMKEVNQTIESGESPKLLIKRTERQKTGEPEIEIVFLGSTKDRHVEDLEYFEKHPLEWTTWGEIVLTPKQTEVFIKALQRMVGIVRLD
ncbi:MAG: hypothetical protein AOA66_0161 [Candidatus Bathyarchaeota archaeon BA2]|nr:MAG: hypothetical protein AOA66_0161 [Candidatus Bathyarchaeota archaeon BA2]